MTREILHIPAQRGLHSRMTQQEHKLRVAAYCRVSTEQDEQLNSLENQITYYTEYIKNNPNYELAGIYADEGISGTSTKRREQFKRMIADCEERKIDLVITKSISRFARNTQDCLNYSRKLKELGIGIRFEKEGINTLDGAGELLFTILSSLAQDESRSISENCAWGVRSLYKQGIFHMNTNRFYGYDKDEKGKLIINPEQAKIVKWIFESYMDGVNPDVLAKKLNDDGVPGCMGEPKWVTDTILFILQNEKHMGDVLLQKTFVSDFLTKKSVKNEGQLEQYHIVNDHEPIVSKELWNATQEEIKRRREYMKLHGLRTMGRHTDRLPFTSRVFCGVCGDVVWRRRMKRLCNIKYQWRCKRQCMGKDSVGCSNDAVWEDDLYRAFIMAWNGILNNRQDFMDIWDVQLKSEDPLVKFRARQFIELTHNQESLEKIDKRLVSRVLEHCDIFPGGIIQFYFLDGTQIEVSVNE